MCSWRWGDALSLSVIVPSKSVKKMALLERFSLTCSADIVYGVRANCEMAGRGKIDRAAMRLRRCRV